jgi:hypothetical protein
LLCWLAQAHSAPASAAMAEINEPRGETP